MPLPFSSPVSLHRYQPFFRLLFFLCICSSFPTCPFFSSMRKFFAVATPLLALIVAGAVSRLWQTQK